MGWREIDRGSVWLRSVAGGNRFLSLLERGREGERWAGGR
jgi:hypothetical protein